MIDREYAKLLEQIEEICEASLSDCCYDTGEFDILDLIKDFRQHNGKNETKEVKKPILLWTHIAECKECDVIYYFRLDKGELDDKNLSMTHCENCRKGILVKTIKGSGEKARNS